ncbi:hypothetical protein [Ilumatobacter sp.]|uniref:hypothetical protein n=1 Tax=Ilumatobacter sp. TaxID=1967498 RepID=UPI0037503DE0
MSKIIVDQIQKSGGTALSLPSTDGTGGQFLGTDGAGNLSFASPSPPSHAPEDTPDIIGSVITNSARQNVYSTGEWSSSGPWTTYYHSWQDANSITQGFNMFMGDGYPNGSSQPFYVNDGENAMTRVKEYAHGRRIGSNRKDYYYYDNITTNYSGVSWRCIPIRNTTASPITRTFNAYLSAVDSAYGGGAVVQYTPNTGIYSTTTGGTWNKIGSANSNTENLVSSSVVVPAETTILLFLCSVHRYETTYRFKDTNSIYNLHTSFGTGLVCDLRMLETLATARIANESTQTIAEPHKLYPACASIYGDR